MVAAWSVEVLVANPDPPGLHTFSFTQNFPLDILKINYPSVGQTEAGESRTGGSNFAIVS